MRRWRRRAGAFVVQAKQARAGAHTKERRLPAREAPGTCRVARVAALRRTVDACSREAWAAMGAAVASYTAVGSVSAARASPPSAFTARGGDAAARGGSGDDGSSCSGGGDGSSDCATLQPWPEGTQASRAGLTALPVSLRLPTAVAVPPPHRGAPGGSAVGQGALAGEATTGGRGGGGGGGGVGGGDAWSDSLLSLDVLARAATTDLERMATWGSIVCDVPLQQDDEVDGIDLLMPAPAPAKRRRGPAGANPERARARKRARGPAGVAVAAPPPVVLGQSDGVFSVPAGDAMFGAIA